MHFSVAHLVSVAVATADQFRRWRQFERKRCVNDPESMCHSASIESMNSINAIIGFYDILLIWSNHDSIIRSAIRSTIRSAREVQRAVTHQRMPTLQSFDTSFDLSAPKSITVWMIEFPPVLHTTLVDHARPFCAPTRPGVGFLWRDEAWRMPT